MLHKPYADRNLYLIEVKNNGCPGLPGRKYNLFVTLMLRGLLDFS